MTVFVYTDTDNVGDLLQDYSIHNDNKKNQFLLHEASMLAPSWGSEFCPSVCPSVTRVLCDETIEHTTDYFDTI